MSILDFTISLDDAVAELRDRVTGAVLTERDPNYAEACAGWNLVFQHHPAVLVVAESAADIAEAVRFARAGGFRVAVQATGPGVARVADGAVLIVTSKMTDVTIDPARRIATVAAGAKWGAVLVPAHEHGLAPLLGSTTDVGAIGYTLGGGMGWLGRRYGLASDSARSFDVVTPDGELVRADSGQNAELFWALKGGGAGTFGVVTSMEIELYPVSTVYAGNLLYPVEMAAEVVARWRDWVAGMDDRLTSSVVIMNFPPLEVVPEPVRGQSFVMVRGCWSGDLLDGEAMINRWRSWRTPALDMFGPMPFSMADTISNDPVDPLPGMVTTELFNSIPDEAIDILVNTTVPQAGQMPLLLVATAHLAARMSNWRVHLLDARLAADRHALAAAEKSGSKHLQLNALLYGISDLTEAGEILEAYTWFLRLRTLAAEVRQPVYDAFVGFFDATVALLRGEYERSAQLADDALLRGLQSHGVNAEQAWSGQTFIRAWDRGELATMTTLVEQAAARPPHLAIWKVAFAACLVSSGRGDEARPVLDELITPDGIAHNPDSLYLAIGALLVEIAREVGTPHHAELLCKHLLPYRGRVVVTGLGRASLGPLDRFIGVAAFMAGDLQLADGIGLVVGGLAAAVSR